jgi:hypothetical protein
MTEEEWLAATDPTPMLEFLRGKASNRKLRLFAVACCRRIPAVDSYDHGAAALGLAERLAEGGATNAERRQMRLSLQSPRPWVPSLLDILAGSASTAATRTSGAVSVAQAASEVPIGRLLGRGGSGTQNPEWRSAANNELVAQTLLLKDIFGNTFRPVIVDPAWLTSTVLTLAEGIYADRAFDRLPVLADALQDAGCENADVLAHCCGDGPHVRGCWVVDLILGKG